MDKHPPIKRYEGLKNFSRDHHHGLLLCWKIKTGLKHAQVERVKKYSDYFFKEYLAPHFQLEEKYIFPLLGEESSIIQEAIEDHRKLRALFLSEQEIEASLVELANELEKHIRFEERVLFKELQRLIPEQELSEKLAIHDHPVKEDDWQDKFWEKK